MKFSAEFKQLFFYLLNKGVAKLSVRLIKSNSKKERSFAILKLVNKDRNSSVTQRIGYFSIDILIAGLLEFIERYSAFSEGNMQELRCIDNAVYKLNIKTWTGSSSCKAVSDGDQISNRFQPTVLRAI